MPFEKGKSGNPGGRKKAIGLSHAVRKSAGLEAWAMAMKILRGEILEPYFDKETEKTIYLAPGAKTRLEAVKVVLGYTWGTPVQQGADELQRRLLEVEERLQQQLGRTLQ